MSRKKHACGRALNSSSVSGSLENTMFCLVCSILNRLVDLVFQAVLQVVKQSHILSPYVFIQPSSAVWNFSPALYNHKVQSAFRILS